MKLFLLSSALALLTQVNAFAPSAHSLLPAFTTSSVVGVQKQSSFGLLNNKNVAISTPSSTQLYMGWGPEPVWSAATVTSNSPACPSEACVSISVEVSAETMEQYKIAGQYVQMKADIDDEDAKPIFLAIASSPAKEGGDDDDEEEEASNTMEFLIKKTDGNDWITNISPSSTIAVSQVLGSGFPMSDELDGFKYDFPTQNVLLFAQGSGIAPIRAAIESGQLGLGKPGQGGRTCRLYYGVQSPKEMPYAEKFGKWEMAGVEVVPVISRPEDCSMEGGWPGRTGYVQNALEEDGVPIPRNSGALLCGVKGMAESVKGTLLKAGVFEGRVLTNF